MSRSAVLNIRIEPEIKASAEELFSNFGLTVTDAVNVFLRQSLMRGGFPFEITTKRPNEMLLASFKEADALLADPANIGYTSIEELNAAMDYMDAQERVNV